MPLKVSYLHPLDLINVETQLTDDNVEFFRCTQYGRDYAIGRNCRFLQGPRSSNASVARLVEALSEGQEICETILN